MMVFKTLDMRQLRTEVLEIEEQIRRTRQSSHFLTWEYFQRLAERVWTQEMPGTPSLSRSRWKVREIKWTEFVGQCNRRRLCAQGSANYTLGATNQPPAYFAITHVCIKSGLYMFKECKGEKRKKYVVKFAYGLQSLKYFYLTLYREGLQTLILREHGRFAEAPPLSILQRTYDGLWVRNLPIARERITRKL